MSHHADERSDHVVHQKTVYLKFKLELSWTEVKNSLLLLIKTVIEGNKLSEAYGLMPDKGQMHNQSLLLISPKLKI